MSYLLSVCPCVRLCVYVCVFCVSVPTGKVWSLLALWPRRLVLWGPDRPDVVRVCPAWMDHTRVQHLQRKWAHRHTAASLVKTSKHQTALIYVFMCVCVSGGTAELLSTGSPVPLHRVARPWSPGNDAVPHSVCPHCQRLCQQKSWFWADSGPLQVNTPHNSGPLPSRRTF